MSARNAIMARFGADSKDFIREMNATQKFTERSLAMMRADAEKTDRSLKKMHGGGHSGGGMNTRMAGDALDSATGTRGWVIRMQMLQHSLPLAAVGALAMGFAKVNEDIDQVNHATREARKELERPLSAQALSPEVAAKSIERIAAQIGKLRESRMMDQDGFFAGHQKVSLTLGTMLGSEAAARSMAAENALLERRRNLATQFKFNVEEEAEARAHAAHSSEHEVELLNIKLKAQEEIAKIQSGADPALMDAEITKVQARQALEIEIAEQKAEIRDTELSLEARLNYIRQSGNDEAVKAAYARVDAAKSELAVAMTTEQKKAGRNKVDAAEWELRNAERHTTELRAQQALAISLAELHASAEVKAYQKLNAEALELRRQTNGATDDEKKKLDVLIAQNAEHQRAAAIAATQKSFSLAGNLIDMTIGPGAREQLRGAMLHRANKANEIAFMQATPETDPAAIAAAQKELHAMDLQIKETIRSRAAGNALAKSETAELQLQLGYQDKLAAGVKQFLDYQAKINQARRDGNKTLEEELTKQQAISLELTTRQAVRDHQDLGKATLAELAAHGHAAGSGKARAAQRWIDRAEKERRRGFEDHSNRLRHRAEAMMQDIGPLKNSEKDQAKRDLKGAIDESEMRKDIRTIAQKFGKAL